MGSGPSGRNGRERRTCSRPTSNLYKGYDWGHAGPPAEIATYGQSNKRKTFDALRELLQSRVRREQKSVYELSAEADGLFDVVVFYGVLYHLRHPLLALDRLRSVCRGCVLIETHVVTRAPSMPASVFYWDDVFYGLTNWCGPSESCVVAWMRSAGFSTIFREKVPAAPGHSRQRFIGTVNDDWRKVFEANQNFAVADDTYFAQMRRETREYLGMNP